MDYRRPVYIVIWHQAYESSFKIISSHLSLETAIKKANEWIEENGGKEKVSKPNLIAYSEGNMYVEEYYVAIKKSVLEE